MDTNANHVAEERGVPRRRGFVAFFLSLLLPGLGQLYSGSGARAWKAFALFLILTFAIVVGSGPLIRIGYEGFLLFVVLSWGLRLPFAIDATVQARRARLTERMPYDRWWAYLLIYLGFSLVMELIPAVVPDRVLGQWLSTQTSYRSFYLPSGSMMPTLQPGDFVISDTSPRTDWKRGDIVILQQPSVELPVTKRIAGLPGETIEFHDGAAFINGERYRPDFWAEDADGEFEATTIPAGHYFVLGDNVNNSRDSRFIGTIPEEQLIGLVLYRFWGSEVGTEFVDFEKR